MSATPKPIDDIGLWFQAFLQPTVLIELGVLLLAGFLAWGIAYLARRSLSLQDSHGGVFFGRRVIDGALFPILLLCLAYVARALLMQTMSVAVMRIAIPVLVSLVVIRVGVKVLQIAFRQAPWVRALERTISWLAWLAMVLWVSGLLPVLLAELEQISWKVGSSTMNLRTVIEGTITAGAVLILSLWVSSAIEARLLRNVVGSELSMRKAVSNASRALLVFVGLIAEIGRAHV